MIDFNIPPHTGKEFDYIKEAVESGKICGDGIFTKKCSEWIEKRYHAEKVLLTTSCTHALEMASHLSEIQPGDEVILPSYTFVSTADAFVLRGAKLVFLDVHPETMNMDERLLEAAITQKTKAIVPVHYAGVSCDMDPIMEIAKRHHLYVIEDAAQGVEAFYKGKALGTIGDFGCYSFHETKNYSMGEGGAILMQKPEYIEKAEILREKGTNRSKFFRGEIDKYTWVDFGSSYLPSELNAAYLWAQFECVQQILDDRMATWNFYHENLKDLEEEACIMRPYIPPYAKHNAHMYYVKTKDIKERTELIAFLKEKGIHCVFHYIPLHSSAAGRRFGRFFGEDRYTTTESERLMRLPMYYGMKECDRQYVTEMIHQFYRQRRS